MLSRLGRRTMAIAVVSCALSASVGCDDANLRKDAGYLDAAPAVNLAASTTMVTQAGELKLIAAATDESAVARVEFYEGSTKLSEATLPPYVATRTFTSADNGSHTFTAVAFDATGHSTTSPEVAVSVAIDSGAGGGGGGAGGSGGGAGGSSGGSGGGSTGGDTVAPVVSMMASANTVTLAGSVTLTAIATDNVGVLKVELWDNFTKVQESNQTVGGPNTYQFTVNYTATDNRAHRYTAIAYDAAINSGVSGPVTVNVVIPNASAIKDMGTSAGCSFVLKQDGTVFVAGNGFYGASGGINSPTFTQLFSVTDVAALSRRGSSYTMLFAKTDGSVLCLGNNMSSNCNVPPSPQSFSTPQTVQNVSNATDVSVGAAHCAKQPGGRLLCWAGFVGNTATYMPPNPLEVSFADGGMFTGTDSVVGCSNGTFVIRDDKTLWAWGRNDSSGNLGVGFTSSYAQTTPVRVVYANNTPVADVTHFACGIGHHVITTADGGVFAFGNNQADGQLGNPSAATGAYNGAIPVAGVASVESLACGDNHTVALDSLGNVWAWGRNTSGQLGTGAVSAGGPSAVQVTGLSNVVKVYANGDTSFALTGGGALYAWGDRQGSGVNDAGTTIVRPTRVLVPGT